MHDPSSIPRRSLLGSVYNQFLGPVLAKDQSIDAESLTRLVLSILGQMSSRRDWPGFSDLIKLGTSDLNLVDPRLEQEIFGCRFKNPVGLAAGFDKDGIAAGLWDRFGFGFAELGTVTLHAQEGNPRPRLFRLASEQAALNRMGFNNEGAVMMKKTLQRQSLPLPNIRPFILGINLGKSRITPLDVAGDDYASSLSLLASYANYVVINVSSPNTPGLRELQASRQLRELIGRVRDVNDCPPLLVKIAPDLDDFAIDEVAKVAIEESLAGVIAVNTSIDRLGLEKRVLPQTGKSLEEEKGGLSGSPVRDRALSVLRRLRASTGSSLPLIGVGGIDSPEVAWERIAAGASLIQLYTGWIFKGPDLVPNILEGLLRQLTLHGFKNISEAVGSEAPWLLAQDTV